MYRAQGDCYNWSHSITHALSINPLDQGSACWKRLYLNKTHNLQEKNIHAPGGIQTRNPSKRVTAEIRLSLITIKFGLLVGQGTQDRITYCKTFWTDTTKYLTVEMRQFHVLSLCYTGACKKNKWAHINTQKYLINNLWLN